MSEKCPECAAGPEGQFGHDSLFTHAFFGPELVMKCRKCGTCWSRRARGEPFGWHETNATSGSLLPTGSA